MLREKGKRKMYVVPPPKRSDPLAGSTNESNDKRVYQTWKGSNASPFFFPTFCLASWSMKFMCAEITNIWGSFSCFVSVL